MTTFEDKLFALIHGLPVADEPMAHLESGPSEPGAFQQFHEAMIFRHAMGQSSAPGIDEIPALAQLLAPRDSRLDAAVMPDAATPPPRFTPDGGSFAKNSERRLEAFREMALKLFPNNPEEIDAMVQLGKETLRDERVAMLTDLAG
jgi:hypothetical protein